MAQRRMFSKTITNSSKFLMMPQSTQNLYFHLGMNADDDGFVEHFTIMRMTESKPDDLKILQAKEFIKVFDDKVLVILDWKENNFIRSDRYTPSKYLELYKNELNEIKTFGIPDDNQTTTKLVTNGIPRLGKDRLGKDRINNKRTASAMCELKPIYIELSKLLYTEHLKHDPNYLSGKDISRITAQWANDIRLLVENDNRDIETVRSVIVWCQEWEGNKSFSWRYNILSGKKLRMQFDTLLGQYQQYGKKKKMTREEIIKYIEDAKK